MKHGDLELDLFSDSRFWMFLLSIYVLLKFYRVLFCVLGTKFIKKHNFNKR